MLKARFKKIVEAGSHTKQAVDIAYIDVFDDDEPEVVIRTFPVPCGENDDISSTIESAITKTETKVSRKQAARTRVIEAVTSANEKIQQQRMEAR